MADGCLNLVVVDKTSGLTLTFPHKWQMVRQLAEDVLVLDPDNADALDFLAAVERALTFHAPNRLLRCDKPLQVGGIVV